tara:strand:- start:147 stop:551 length:405 start_codon:yes stop_codon:yes gene_type:complete
MNQKQIMKNKVKHLENALLEADFIYKAKEIQCQQLQEKINKYKETEDKTDLTQNNELIMDLIQKRLDVGAGRYLQHVPIMPEDDMTRDNFYEAIEEALDLCVYTTAFMLRLMKEKEKLESELVDKTKSKEKSSD